MYERHWGLRETPLALTPDPRRFYQGTVHEEALARLDFLVEQRRRLGLVLGAPGSGKSLLLAVFADQLRRRPVRVARANLQGLTPTELLYQLGVCFGVAGRPADAVGELWMRLTDRVVEYRYQQWTTVLLLDDADLASEACLGLLPRLARLDASPQARLTLILAGCPNRMARLDPALLEQAELRIDLEAWEPEETIDFIEAALTRAGRGQPLFTREALLRLHALAQGVPRRVVQLADLALLAGAGRELSEIDAAVVESAFRELGVIEV